MDLSDFEMLDRLGYVRFDEIRTPERAERLLGLLGAFALGRSPILSSTRPAQLTLFEEAGYWDSSARTFCAASVDPPRYVGLLAINVPPEQPGLRVLDLYGKNARGITEELKRTVLTAVDDNGVKRSLKAFENKRGIRMFRWDEEFCKPWREVSVPAPFFRVRADSVEWRPGCLVVLDNWRVAHSLLPISHDSTDVLWYGYAY